MAKTGQSRKESVGQLLMIEQALFPQAASIIISYIQRNMKIAKFLKEVIVVRLFPLTCLWIYLDSSSLLSLC